MSVNVPPESPISKGAYCFCHGPFAFASTQVQKYDDRWVCWVATEGMRYGKFSEIGGLGDDEGSANELFTAGERPAHLSFCFDQDARPVIAIQQDATTIELRRKVAGIVTAYVWTGNSPQIFYNGIVVPATSDSDVVAFYLKPAGDAIFARFQRDNFAIEYTINSLPGVVLTRLSKVDRNQKGGKDYCILYAEDQAGRQVVLQSDAFPPLPIFLREPATLSVGFQSGTTQAVTVIEVLPAEKAVGSAGFGSGIYFSVVVPATQPLEKATASMSFSTGTYTLTVMPADQGTEKGTGATAFLSGSYVLKVISGGSFSEKSTGAVGFQSGSYS